jgi:hypothetical protein
LEANKREPAKIVGEEAVEMIALLATFEVEEFRLLIDFGQGWERGI